MTSRAGRPKRANLSSLTDQVYEYVRVAIIQGDLQPSEKLVQLNIAAQIGSSQGPVREALQRLERDGLVERRVRSATFVSSVSLDEMYDLFAIRCAIEGFAIQRTAQSITADQCENLITLIQKMVQVGKQHDIFMLAEYDLEFHQLIIEWSGSAVLRQVWTPLSGQIQRFIVQSHPEHYPDFVNVGARHQTIIDALQQHDANQAINAIQEHIMLIWSHITP